MGEDSIRGKLGNSRLGVAIMADIRPLNHLALKPILSAPVSPLLPHSPACSCLWDLVRLKELDQSACSLQTFGPAVDKSSHFLSWHQNTHRKEDTLSDFSWPGRLLLSVIQRGSAEGLKDMWMSIWVHVSTYVIYACKYVAMNKTPSRHASYNIRPLAMQSVSQWQN